ncbi:phage tail assembly chaperone [Ewingella americana]|uniref:phage tail assembly chaperone n=1 Tax=Ewingella americana TaxID=41202 RepID=UPI001639F8BD|nr:phage tail assembly chaperone [Ewingella americana]QMV50961.1 phage tail protein [Ewingella americana]
MTKKALAASLRALALAPSGAYRTKETTVPEWDGAKVILREPSGQAWTDFQALLNPEVPEGEEPTKLTPAETFIRNRAADVILFIDVLLDEEGQPVFSGEDRDEVAQIYGPVHVRLLKQAIALGVSQEDAEKK